MRALLPIIVTGFAVLTTLNQLSAASVTYTTTTNVGTGPTVTYTETVGPATTPPTPPAFFESSSSCTSLSTTGCQLVSFSGSLPAIVIPTGDYVTSASLDLHYVSSITETRLSLVSVTAINPNLPTTAGTAGSHFGSVTGTVDSPAGSFFEGLGMLGFGGGFTQLGIDYTSKVQLALAEGVSLAPLTIDEDLAYGGMTAQSPEGGVNSATTFDDTFSLGSASLAAVLTINFAPVPEPATVAVFGFGLVILGAYFRHKRVWA